MADHKDPIRVAEVVEELPPRTRQTNSDDVIEQVIAEDGMWVKLDTGGRKPGSVLTTMKAAAERHGVKVETASRGSDAYIRAVAYND